MSKLSKFGVLFIAALQGGYMLFDGVHQLTTGQYFGGRVGPWAKVVSAVGLQPDAMAPVFIVVGILWLVAGLALLLNLRWSRPLLVGLAVVLLAYLVFGTILSLVLLALMRIPAGRVQSSLKTTVGN